MATLLRFREPKDYNIKALKELTLQFTRIDYYKDVEWINVDFSNIDNGSLPC